MNRLRSHKIKLNNANTNGNINIDNSNDNNHDNSNNHLITSYNGLLNKLSKRYSTLSNKIRGRSPKRKSSSSTTTLTTLKSTQNVLSGSYNMTGLHSEDHRLEIGAPILISSTTIDADRFDVSEERLKMIGGGIAATNNTLIKLKDVKQTTQQPVIMPTTSSSGSENDEFVDAVMAMDINDQDDELQSHNELDKECNNSKVIYATPTKLENSISKVNGNCNCESPLQSINNLHRSELKIYLKNDLNDSDINTSPQVLRSSLTINTLEDLPNIPELYGSLQHLKNYTEDENDHDADKENSSPSMIGGSSGSKSERNTPTNIEPKPINRFQVKQKRYQSAENLMQRKKKKRRSVVFNSTTCINNHQEQDGNPNGGLALRNDSKDSILSHLSNYDDYDLKSVSCHSLNVQSLFVSIDELNEITQQINETEEFNQAIDLEYCMHRDQLKPSERRITLLKNKNARLINLMHNKDKLKKSWCDMKQWIEEEGSKLRVAVQRQPLIQRVGSSKLNLNQLDIQKHQRRRSSPSANTTYGTLRSHLDKIDNLENSTFSLNHSEIMNNDKNNDNKNCNNSENNENNNDNDLISPANKKFRQEGQNGFEELRRYVKQGGDFAKELVLILQERIDSEQLYSKSLSKMANKLNKACRELPGSIAEAWRSVATEMESRSDIHRQLSASLNDEIVKPLKAIVDSHHKSRKSVESTVDKSSRTLAEWRASEAKAKKTSHAAARENEKLQDAMLDVRIQKSPSIALLHQGPNKTAAEKEIKTAEKDCAKLDGKRKKAEEAVKKADVEYYTLCVRAERARVDWEMSVLRGSTLLQTIENQRLINMKNFVSNYTRLTQNMNPIIENVVQRLQPQVEACNVMKDMQIIKNIRRNAEGPSEQLLPDFYCEHTTLAMNRERRKQALVKLLQLVKTDLERERRSRNGLKNLSQTLTTQENQNVADKLYHIRSMLTYLEGARFKLQAALLELDHKPRNSHPLAQHIQITRDRTGLQQSILKVPIWLKNNDKINTNNHYNGEADNNEYECVSSPSTNNTTISTTQINCLETLSTASEHSVKNVGKNHYNRSKSNIETLNTQQTEICINATTTTTTKLITASAITTKILGGNKCKTLNSTQTYSNSNGHGNVHCIDRGQADGGSNQQDSDFDEFSSPGEDEDDDNNEYLQEGRKDNNNKNLATVTNGVNFYENTTENYQNNNNNNNSTLPLTSSSAIVLSRCRALYSYTPKLYDELELAPGDIIEVHAKQDDGWWLGALHNQIGIFPATYVEEFV